MEIRDGKLINHAPETGEELSRHDIAADEDIKLAYKKAAEAQKAWKEESLKERVKMIAEMKNLIANNIDAVKEKICEDTGKTGQEALTADILPTLRIIRYYEKYLPDILSPKSRSTPLMDFNNRAYVEFFPRGIIAIISPWNYPLQLALVPAITALAAGNAVILKPSEITPLVGEHIENLYSCLDNAPENLLQVLQGGGEVGSRIIAQKPDMVFFTGSQETGRKIMKQAGESLTPLELELGGKDPMIVLDDAGVDRAANAAVYGAFTNTGQLCVSVERAYVHQDIAGEFIRLVKEKAESLRWQKEASTRDYGPFTHPEQKQKVRELVEDALKNGARSAGELPDAFRDDSSFCPPVILTGVEESMRIMQEEIFGPVLPILTFQEEKKVIDAVNASSFGLNSSIFSQDRGRARRLAGELETGNCIINDLIRNVANPDLPFGGVKSSGMGRYHGPEGLKTFSNYRSITVNRNNHKKEINWFPSSQKLSQNLSLFLKTFYGTASKIKNIPALISLMILLIKNRIDRGGNDNAG